MTGSEGGEERHQQFYRKLVEESADIATIIDEDGTITYVSPSVQDVLGYEPADLMGENGFNFQPKETRMTVRDAIQHIQEHPDASHTVQTKFRRADGTYCWIEVTLRNRLDDPVIDGILVMSRDISARKEQQQQYQELAAEYETVLNNAVDALFLLDVQSTDAGVSFQFRRLSPSYERQTGLRTREVQGKTPREVFGEDRGLELTANYHRCVRAREPVSYEEEFPVGEDARFWSTVLAPVITEGEVTGLVGITRNVTERVRHRRQLERQNEQLDEFASVVSHDLRNPLNVAQLRADLLREEHESDHLAPLVQALDRMEHLLEDTLTLARQGQVVSEMETFPLADLLEQCWGSVVTGEATLELGHEVTIRGDQSRLQHLFENLFRNAVEHGRKDATVRAGQAGEHRIYVEDDGQGIPEDSRDTVLKPGHTSASDGTGFGLAIANRIAEAHGWTMQITEGNDGGARFEFRNVEIVQQ